MKNTPIILEKINVSDINYHLTEINVESGEVVTKGQILFSFETSKADIEYEAPESGYFIHDLIVGSEINPGVEIAFICFENVSIESLVIKANKTENNKSISAKAKRLIDINKLDISVFGDLENIKENDVLTYLEEKNKSTLNRSFKNDLIIIGGKGGCKMVIEAIRSTNHYQIKGICDTTLSKGESVMGVPVIANSDEDLIDLKNNGYNKIVFSFTSLDNLKIREAKYHHYKSLGFDFPNIIHNKATVEPSVLMGDGNIVLANSMLGSDVMLGNLNFINTGAMICHDTILNFNNHCAPNAVLAGRIKVGENNVFGMCSTIFYDVVVGSNNVISNGTNIFNHIKDNTFQK